MQKKKKIIDQIIKIENIEVQYPKNPEYNINNSSINELSKLSLLNIKI